MISILKKLPLLLGTNLRGRLVIVFFLMLFGMLLEMFSIGFVLPIIGLIASPELINRYPAGVSIMDQLGNPKQSQLLIGGIIILCTIYGIKNLYLLALAWIQSSFVFAFQASLSKRLFDGYLHRPYSFHIVRNSSQLIRNIIVEVNQLTNSMQAIMTLGTELLVLAGVSLLLVYFEPKATLTLICIFGVAAGVFYFLVRRSLSNWGRDRQKNEEKRIQVIQEGLGSIKEIKLLARESDFLRTFELLNLSNARVYRNQLFLQQVPRLWLEMLAVSAITIIFIMHIIEGRSIAEFLPIVGLFGAAAFRLIPSINRCLISIQSARFAISSISAIHQDLVEGSNIVKEMPRQLFGKVIRLKGRIELSGVNFKYPGSDREALNNINLSIPRGTSIGFIGESGAGKSTLVDVILGLLAPSSGVVKVDGVDIRDALRGWQKQIGYVPQTIYLTDDTLRRNVAFGLVDADIDEAAVWRTLRAAQLEDFVRQLPEGLDTVVGERGVRLSGGQRQRIGIARALYHDPSVLVLDEATSALDTDTESGVMEAIRAMRGEKTILIITHRLSTVEHCDSLVRLVAGQIVETS